MVVSRIAATVNPATPVPEWPSLTGWLPCPGPEIQVVKFLLFPFPLPPNPWSLGAPGEPPLSHTSVPLFL
jgi:hypothetical protein